MSRINKISYKQNEQSFDLVFGNYTIVNVNNTGIQRSQIRNYQQQDIFSKRDIISRNTNQWIIRN
jgi:hypothetical protein